MGVLTALVTTASMLLPGLSAARPSIEVIGTFTPTTVSPHYFDSQPTPYASWLRLFIDESARLLYTADSLSPGFAAAYDLDTLEPRGDGIELTGGQRHAVAVLEDHGWLVVASGPRGSTAFDVLRSTPTGIELVGSVPVGTGGLGGPDQSAVGMAAVPGTKLVFVISSHAVSNIGGTTTVSLVDLEGVEDGGGAVRWTQPLNNCISPARLLGLPAAIGWVEETSSVYFTCADVSTVLFDSLAKAPTPSGIGRLHIEGTDGPPDSWSAGPFVLYPHAGDFRDRLSVFDPTTKRVMAAAGGVTEGGTMYAFDTLHSAYVGGLTVGPNPLSAIGISSSGGRVYARAPNTEYGLLAADTATTPLEQGRAFPEYGGAIGTEGGSGRIEMIAVDGSTRRIFMPPTTQADGNTDLTPHWFVLKDHLPPHTPPTAADPDRNTTNLPEVPGVTGRTFGGAAQGYGFRARQVGGTKGLLFNVVAFDANTDAVVSGGTREARSAYLERIGLTDGEAAADVIAADRDDGATGADQARSGTDWPVEHAQCADFGDGMTDDSADGSHVSCNYAERTVEANSRAGQSTVDGVGVESSTLKSTIRLDDAAGIAVEVTTTADGIGVPGLLSVGRVRVTTTASAHGRPGTAAGTFTRTVEDVAIAGQVVCTTDCDVDEIATTFNEQFAGRARLDFPLPDADLAAGSPGGYQAIVQRGREQQVQAIFEDEQEANRVEVPGMVLYLYQDNTVPAHSVYEFAGTQAEARYGIFPLGREDDPEPGPEPADQGGGGGGGSPGSGDGATGTTPLGPFAGGAGTPAVAQPGGPVAPTPAVSGGVSGLVEEILSLILNDPATALAMLPMWGLLLAPVYLSARRALYVRRARLTSGATA